MANNDTLLGAAGLTRFEQGIREVLRNAARTQAMGGSDVLTSEIKRLQFASDQQADAVAQNTKALLQSTILGATGSSGSAAETAAKWALGMATGGLAPLISGLIGLFGGGSQDPVPLLAPYVPPQSAALEGWARRDGTEWQWRDGVEPAGSRPAAVPQQVTVQVQAMDSKSFLDHKDEIARAVRQAVLNSHSLNDVLAEL